MKYFGILLIVSLAAGLHLARSQVSDCTAINNALGIPPSDPVTVPDLPVCVDQRDMAQCCSTEFILDSLTTTEQLFLQGLRIELRERFQSFENIVQRLREFVQGGFLTSYVARLGNFGFLNGRNGRGPANGRGNQIVNNLIAAIRNRIDFDPDDDDDVDMPTQGSQNGLNGRGGFSVRGLLGNLVSSIANATAEVFTGPGNGAGRQCIRRIIENQVQEQSMAIQAEGLQQIRRVVASIDTLRDFVRNFTENLAGFRPLQQCITAIVQLNTCGRCEAVLPPFCENVCGAIARACYSPLNDALEDQLEQLWEVVRRILAAATDAITELNASRGILNITAAISQISAECQINIPLPGIRARRQSDYDDSDDEDDDVDIPIIPGLIRAAAAALRGGLFDDDDDEPMGAIGICRLINTTSSNCWDGTQNRTEDIEEFDGEDVLDQVNNPVISIPQDQLIDQVTSIGTPITNVITSPAFAEVAPLGLVLPDTGPAPGPNNGAAVTFLTLTSLALMLMASCLFI